MCEACTVLTQTQKAQPHNTRAGYITRNIIYTNHLDGGKVNTHTLQGSINLLWYCDHD